MKSPLLRMGFVYVLMCMIWIARRCVAISDYGVSACCGFALGSTIESKTKGIWAWCMDHPVHEDQTLLLLDTEGLGDIKKGDSNNDNQILTLATLLSSTLIYNSLGTFDENTLNKMKVKNAAPNVIVEFESDLDIIANFTNENV